jgi:hypothetical protein
MRGNNAENRREKARNAAPAPLLDVLVFHDVGTSKPIELTLSSTTVPRTRFGVASGNRSLDMRSYVVPLFLAAVISTAASGHHSHAIFSEEIIAFQGEVIRFDWANPHSYIYVAAHDANSAATTPGESRAGSRRERRSAWSSATR